VAEDIWGSGCIKPFSSGIRTPAVAMSADLSRLLRSAGLRLTVTLVSRSGARGSVVVNALCYKPEGSGFDTR
jgi:hypothetical protein